MKLNSRPYFRDDKPTWSYDPDKIPSSSARLSRLRYVSTNSLPVTETPKRLTQMRIISVQNLYQFDSDHVLDVHEARLYPFDTYYLTTNLRAEIPGSNTTTPTPTSIVRLVTLTDTASFIVRSFDASSTVSSSPSPPSSPSDTPPSLPSRDLDMTIKRPGEARFFALMLFGISWMLAHATVGYVVLAWKSTSSSSSRVAYYLVLCVITMMVIPQLRNAMPDAPGYDGQFQVLLPFAFCLFVNKPAD